MRRASWADHRHHSYDKAFFYAKLTSCWLLHHIFPTQRRMWNQSDTQKWMFVKYIRIQQYLYWARRRILKLFSSSCFVFWVPKCRIISRLIEAEFPSSGWLTSKQHGDDCLIRPCVYGGASPAAFTRSLLQSSAAEPGFNLLLRWIHAQRSSSLGLLRHRLSISDFYESFLDLNVGTSAADVFCCISAHLLSGLKGK